MTPISVHLTSRIRLEQAIKQTGITDPASIEHLTVTGTFTQKDFDFIESCMDMTLEVLDLGGVTIRDCDFFFSHKLSRLTSYVLPDRLIKETISLDYPNLSSFTIHPDNPVWATEDGVLYNKKKTILKHFPLMKQGDYFMPKPVRYIKRAYVFDCLSLSSITVHPGNPYLASENGILFNKAKTKLIKYPYQRQCACIIPASVTEIRHESFYDCRNLTDFEVHPDNPVFASDGGILYNKDTNRMICYPPGRQGDYVIPDSVTAIGDMAFESCRGLTSITIPRSVSKIRSWEFAGCTGLTSVVIPDSVTEIEKCTFNQCTGLASVTIPNSIIKIGEGAFYETTGLTSIAMPNKDVEEDCKPVNHLSDYEEEYIGKVICWSNK